MQLSVLSSWPRLFVQVFEQQGVDTQALLKKLNIDASILEDPNARLPTLAVVRFWQLAAQSCPAELPLIVARGVNAGTFHALGFAMATSQTGMEAIRRLEQYYPMLTTSVQLTLLETDDLVGIRLSSSDLLEALKAQFADHTLAESVSQLRESAALGLLSLCRSFFGIQFSAERMTLKRSLGELYKPYQEHVQCTLLDQAEYDEVWFSKSDLNKPLPSANPLLAKLNDQIVESYLNMLKEDVVVLVTSEIIKQLPSGDITQASVAAALNMSTRTLQRKLTDNEQSFRRLLNETRQELALQYIQYENIPVLEIGYRLGFSEPANFTRAFKQWTGQPPVLYRQQFSERKGLN
ncbi:AraC family transcriptional regulator ligand-binding domain-containing protein [Reinekea sp.]|uniref:AraC family transcriptional regulator n=1 Tax=Reinekea sp. TaxID=1970455 RepID=UPI0039891DEE